MNDKEVMAVVLVLAMICTLIGFAYHERTKSDDAYSRGYAAAADSCRAVARIDSMATAASVGVLATLVRMGADTSLVVLLPSGHIARVSK